MLEQIIKPTEEQEHILTQLSSADDNLLIHALAGTGKTSTLELIERASNVRPILCLAFNKRIAEKMEKRFQTTTTVRTFNSLGHRIWSKANASNLKLDPKKSQVLFKETVAALKKDRQREAWEVYWEVCNAVALAKSLGYVPDHCFPQARRLLTEEDFHASLDEVPSPLTISLIDTILAASIKAAYNGFIDYNDQIYMPALFGGTFPRFPLVMVDEDQDLSPTNHAMLDKLVKHRLIAVGDEFQTIYVFRGAQQGGMAAQQKKFRMKSCDLSISFRCPRAIVENVRWRVPKFRWIKEGGHVERLLELPASHVQDSSAIICRNNAPLFRVAFNLLASGRSVSVAGSDIGPKLIGIMRKLSEDDATKPKVLAAIESWREDKLSKGSTTADDMAACMRIFAGHAANLGQAIAYAEHLFSQKGSIRLLTGHKAKGLEFDTVYFLDPWLVGADEQEQNLRYVISTRARQELYEIDSRNIKWT